MNFLVESGNFLLVFLALYGSTTIQSRLFLKNIENFVWFSKQYLLGFFILEKFWTKVSCFSVILFYSTLLALTDRQKDRQRAKSNSIRFFLAWCNNRSCQARLHPSNMGQWFFVLESFFRQAHQYEKSMKHCSHGSISCVNNANTGNPTLIS
jgi:hypothetical protein